MSAIDMPDCPSCGEDLSMEFGNVDFDDGLVHHFDCEHCGNHEAWSLEEMSERGVERPSLSDFIEHYDLTREDVREQLSEEELRRFLQSFDVDMDEIRNRSLRDIVRDIGITVSDITGHFDDDQIAELREQQEEEANEDNES